MKVSIHQPSYWPWLGQLAKIAKSDRYVALDSVDAVRDDFQYRNIFYCGGEAKYLTLPVNYRMGMPIKDLEFKSDVWKIDHLNKLANYYRKAPFFEEVFQRVRRLYSTDTRFATDFIMETMRLAFDALKIKAVVVKSSSLNVSGRKGDLVLEICRASGASEYIAGRGSFGYMQEVLDDFKSANIRVTWHEYTHPQYGQDPRHPFVSGLACLDLLFFQGPERANEIFWKSVDGDPASTPL